MTVVRSAPIFHQGCDVFILEALQWSSWALPIECDANEAPIMWWGKPRLTLCPSSFTEPDDQQVKGAIGPGGRPAHTRTFQKRIGEGFTEGRIASHRRTVSGTNAGARAAAATDHNTSGRWTLGWPSISGWLWLEIRPVTWPRVLKWLVNGI